MRRTIFFLMAVLFVVGPAGLVVAAGDPAAEETLKTNGLRRAGAVYVLAGETEVQKRLNAAKALSRQFAMTLMQQRGMEQGVRDKKTLLQELVQRRMLLNRQLPLAQTTVQHNQIVSALNEVNDQIGLLQDPAGDAGNKKALDTMVSQRREAYMQAMLDLRRAVDETREKYTELAKSDEVKNALAALNRTSKTKLTLGPSRAFLVNVKAFEKAEGSVSTEAIPLREHNGVFELDVVFNNKVLKPLCLDTGASLISLSAEVASQIGLKPSKSDPDVVMETADGSKVKAKLMRIPAVRVGKFQVEDVPCVVAPAELGDVPLLLGGSFLKNFSYRVDPGGGKLMLTKVETDDAPKAKGSTKDTGRTPKGKRSSRPSADGDGVVTPGETP